jgi:chromosome segregation ATPase
MATRKEIEIIPPSRLTQVDLTAETPHMPPVDRNPGGLISSHPVRWEANAQSRSFDAMTRRSSAQRSLMEAEAALGRSLISNARTRHEFDELPQTLALDRYKRQVQRVEEVRDLLHQVELAQARRDREIAEIDMQVTKARSDLSHARTELAVAQRALVNADQELESQRQHGKRYHDLGWEHRIGERELYVEEQRAVLAEHRGRISDAAKFARASDEELLNRRAEMNADGLDTRTLDDALARKQKK